MHQYFEFSTKKNGLSSLSNTLCDVATALDLAAEVTAGEENEDPGNDESWLAQATTVRDFVFQDLPSTLVEVVAKARGGISKHMWPPETAIESCSNTCRNKVRLLPIERIEKIT